MCELNAKEIFVEISKEEVNVLLGICLFPFGLY